MSECVYVPGCVCAMRSDSKLSGTQWIQFQAKPDNRVSVAIGMPQCCIRVAYRIITDPKHKTLPVPSLKHSSPQKPPKRVNSITHSQ